jgi:hypothetical protein
MAVGAPAACPETTEKSSEPNCLKIRNAAREKPKSPMRLTMNALLPASVAIF